MTGNELFAKFTLVMKDTTDVGADMKKLWLNMIENFLYRQVLETDPQRLITSTSVSFSSSISSVALPAGFFSIGYKDCGLYQLDANSNPIRPRLEVTEMGSTLSGYYLQGGSIWRTPIPVAAETCKLFYIPVKTQVTDLTAQIFLLDMFQEYMLTALQKFYYEWDRDVGMEQFSDQKFMRVLIDLYQTYRQGIAVHTPPNPNAGY